MHKVNFESNDSVQHIVITGGPCAGKSSVLNAVSEWLTKQGLLPLFIDEAATRLQKLGIRPAPHYFDPMNFEDILLRMQLNNEELFYMAGKQIAKTTGKRVVIIQDRGILDVAAYIDKADLEGLLQSNGKSLDVELQKYTAAIHLVTAADGAPHAYTTKNNEARRESPEQAIELDQKTYDAYLGSE